MGYQIYLQSSMLHSTGALSTILALKYSLIRCFDHHVRRVALKSPTGGQLGVFVKDTAIYSHHFHSHQTVQ